MEVYDFGRELKVGEQIVFLDMIHYTMVKTTMFNGVNHPAIAIWKENDQLEIIRQFSYEDFKRRLS
jgi:carboxynorspermidine decarboxylase